MPIDDRTANRSYQLPNAANLLSEDVTRLRAALQAIDADIFARYTKTEVDQLITNLINSAPGALDTLNELAAAMGNDPNFSATVINALALKAPLASPALTGTPTAPNAAPDTNTTQLATTAFVIAQAYLKAATAASLYAPLASPVFTGTPQLPNLNGGALGGLRNVLINGSFSVWQRGTTFSNPSNPTYLADRWVLSYDGTGAARTVSRQAHSPVGELWQPPLALAGQPLASGQRWFLRYQQTTAGSGGTFTSLLQKIPRVMTLAGRQVTLSFLARAGGLLELPAIQLLQHFGTGGSPTSAVFTQVATNVGLDTQWTLFTFTATLPAIASGATLGTNEDDWVGLDFKLPCNAVYQVDLANVQLEVGPIATPFESRLQDFERQLCLPFGQWVPFNMLFYASVAGQYLETSLSWPAMRKTPVAGTLVTDPNTTQSAFNNSQNFIGRLTPNGGSCILQATAAGTSAYVTGYRAWLDAEL
jgi:hypothetical protein